VNSADVERRCDPVRRNLVQPAETEAATAHRTLAGFQPVQLQLPAATQRSTLTAGTDSPGWLVPGRGTRGQPHRHDPLMHNHPPSLDSVEAALEWRPEKSSNATVESPAITVW